MGEIEVFGLSAPLNWEEKKIFFSVPFTSRTILVWFSMFKLKMDQITKAEQL